MHLCIVQAFKCWLCLLFKQIQLQQSTGQTPSNRIITMQKLTKAEEDVMQLLWEIGRGTVSDLLERCPEPKPPHSTISSVVRILEKKGFVGHKAYGKTHEYFPLVEREAYGKRSLGDLLRNYFGGSVPRLVSHLAETENLSKTEMEEMMKLLDK